MATNYRQFTNTEPTTLPLLAPGLVAGSRYVEEDIHSTRHHPTVQTVKHQLDQVTGIMRENVVKVLDRDVVLGDLEVKAENLRDGSTRYEHSSRKLKRQMCCKNFKVTMILVAVVLLIILFIVLMAVYSNRKK